MMTNSINCQAIHLLRTTEKNDLGGGIGIFLKNGLNCKLRDDLQNSHIESIRLEILEILKKNEINFVRLLLSNSGDFEVFFQRSESINYRTVRKG